MRFKNFTKCQICSRNTPDKYIERHHLIPRRQGGQRRRIQGGYISVCCDCGDILHKLFTNKQLAIEYNTLEKILNSEKIVKWINYISNRPDDFSVNIKNIINSGILNQNILVEEIKLDDDDDVIFIGKEGTVSKIKAKTIRIERK